ncbi:MAG: isoprenylcysteine carboxylmethyltransferase family protein [Pseudorhodoplanes sp.]|nr:isoprenylcysteine carboxylmethyltransferase family protein [Pseudorhodoplanes sp.]
MPFVFDLVGRQWQRKIMVWAAVAVGIAVLMAMRPVWPEGAYGHEAIERAGIFCILIGILGRTWCTMYIGGHKLNRLVTEGPYSVTRNPLYLFSAIAAFGVGAQLGSIVFALLCAAATIAVFALVIRHEERALAQRFPAEFALYKARVPRLLPSFCGWQDAETIMVRPAAVHRTFRDATLFLVAVPGLKALEGLRDGWAIGPLFNLY